MRRIYTLRVRGWEVASLEVAEDESDTEGITGGSMSITERDLEPYDPERRIAYEYDFGFRS